MNINILYSNTIEGEGIFNLLQNAGYEVKLHHLNLKYSLYPPDKERIFIIDIKLLDQINKPHKRWLCKSRYHIILLGTLQHFFSFFDFNCKPRGFICKKENLQDLYSSIKTLSNHKSYLSKKTQSFLKKKPLLKQNELFNHKVSYHLTATELKVMQEISEGKTTPEIAQKWNRSPHTINNHRKNIMKKLSLDGVFRLSKFCLLHKKSIQTLISIRKNKKLVSLLLKNNQE